MIQIVVFPRGQLNKDDRQMLRQEGIIALEADDPKSVVSIVPMIGASQLVGPNDMLMSALMAIEKSSLGAGHFFSELYRRMRAQERAAQGVTE